jgi:hypothetical protein
VGIIIQPNVKRKYQIFNWSVILSISSFVMSYICLIMHWRRHVIVNDVTNNKFQQILCCNEVTCCMIVTLLRRTSNTSVYYIIVSFGRLTRKWKDNIKMYNVVMGCGYVIGFF